MARRLAWLVRDHASGPEYVSVLRQDLVHQSRNCRSVESLHTNSNDGWPCRALNSEDCVEIGVERDNHPAVLPRLMENLNVGCREHPEFADVRTRHPIGAESVRRIARQALV